jgi:hypothetical protein
MIKDIKKNMIEENMKNVQNKKIVSIKKLLKKILKIILNILNVGHKKLLLQEDIHINLSLLGIF